MAFLNVRRPIYGGNVRLMLSGKEISSTLTRIAGSSETYRSERRLLTIYQTLYSRKCIDKGKYSLPFNVTLPLSIPGTQQYPDGRKKPLNGFRIQYKLQVSLGKIVDSISLNVRSAPIASEPLPCMIQPKSFPVSTLKLLKQGQVTLGASVADTAVGRGEAIALGLAFRNESTVDIRRVAIKLVENMSWVVESQGLIRESSRVLVHLRDVDLPSLSRDRKERAEVRRLVGKGSSQIELVHHALYEDLVSGIDKVQVVVPEHTRDSYDGHLVKVSHVLRITLQTRSISSNATISIPINIGTPRSISGADLNTIGSPIHTETDHTPMSNLRASEIPVAHAVQIDSTDDQVDDDVESVIILGSDAVLPAHTPDLSDLEPLAPPFSPDISMSNLLQRMDASCSAHSFISSLLMEAAWVRFFCCMSATDYASIIRHVTPVADQPRVASLLAGYVNGGDALTCEWATFAVQATEQCYRAPTVQRLLPHCTDLLQNHWILRGELSAWDQTVTSGDFAQALAEARRQ